MLCEGFDQRGVAFTIPHATTCIEIRIRIKIFFRIRIRMLFRIRNRIMMLFRIRIKIRKWIRFWIWLIMFALPHSLLPGSSDASRAEFSNLRQELS